MLESQVSRTAEFMALFRALESSRPAGQRLFYDPFAHHFLSSPLRVVANISRVGIFHALVSRYIDARWPGARISGIARTRLIDDLLNNAVHDGIQQVVLLGAGYDCRAYRIGALLHARIFEVDYPATLAAKRTKLQHLLASLPTNVSYVPIDFNHEQLAEVMADAGFDTTRHTFFIWEGVTNYLTAPAVDATLRFVHSAAPGSQIAFTYVHRGLLDGSAQFLGSEAVARLVGRAGEPWTFGIDPDEVPEYLAARGLRLLEDLGAQEYRAHYMPGQPRGYEFYRAVLAEVTIGAEATTARL